MFDSNNNYILPIELTFKPLTERIDIFNPNTRTKIENATYKELYTYMDNAEGDTFTWKQDLDPQFNPSIDECKCEICG